MILLYFAVVVFSAAYVFLILHVVKTWRGIPERRRSEMRAKTFVSILVPFRNEEAHLPFVVSMLEKQDYPSELFEVLFIDDFSTDASAQIIQHSRFELLHVNQHPNAKPNTPNKKRAIELGIAQARGSLILTTDADVEAAPSWISMHATMTEAYNKSLTTGTVLTQRPHRLLDRMQSLDYLATMVFTGAGIESGLFFSANGASLSYQKDLFAHLGGFDGNVDMASGDDVFLVQKASVLRPEVIGFIKDREAVVYVQPEITWKDLYRQRLRWGGKVKRFKHNNTRMLMWFLLTFNCLIFIMFLAGVFFDASLLLAGSIMLAIKFAVDYCLLRIACRYYGQESALQLYPITAVVHWTYMIVCGLMSIIGHRPTWKGRKI